MNTLTNLKTALTALALGLALLPGAQAQGVQFPAGLKWEMMKFASFMSGSQMKASATDAEKKAALEIWKKELHAIPPNERYDRSKDEYPADVLISTYENDKYKFAFTILGALNFDYPACEDAENGPFPQGYDFDNAQTYPVCSIRVVRMDKSSRQAQQWVLPKYCFVYEDYSEKHPEMRKNHPLADNHTEIAIHDNTAYFRVIQGGRWVPACNRSIKLQ